MCESLQQISTAQLSSAVGYFGLLNRSGSKRPSVHEANTAASSPILETINNVSANKMSIQSASNKSFKMVNRQQGSVEREQIESRTHYPIILIAPQWLKMNWYTSLLQMSMAQPRKLLTICLGNQRRRYFTQIHSY